MNSGTGFSERRDWRIKSIPFTDQRSMMETNGWALFGAFLFIGGILAGLLIKALFAMAMAGLVIGLVGILFRARITRRSWKKVQAIVIDKECKKVLGAPGQRGGARTCWAFRLLCEFEMDGKRFTVTPDYWSTFLSESGVQGFLERVVSADGKCQLWVNPGNPLQAELVATDIKSFLLH